MLFGRWAVLKINVAILQNNYKEGDSFVDQKQYILLEMPYTNSDHDQI
jgi:hypothetical protein